MERLQDVSLGEERRIRQKVELLLVVHFGNAKQDIFLVVGNSVSRSEVTEAILLFLRIT